MDVGSVQEVIENVHSADKESSPQRKKVKVEVLSPSPAPAPSPSPFLRKIKKFDALLPQIVPISRTFSRGRSRSPSPNLIESNHDQTMPASTVHTPSIQLVYIHA